MTLFYLYGIFVCGAIVLLLAVPELWHWWTAFRVAEARHARTMERLDAMVESDRREALDRLMRGTMGRR